MANFNFNKVILGGRITKDIELKKAGETSVANFSLAINRAGKKDEADFVNCTAFGKSAEMAATYFHKGSCMCIEGRIQVDNYEKDGEKKTSTKAIVERIVFVDSKSEATAGGSTPAEKAESTKSVPVPEASGSDDEDLPF